MHTPLGPGGTPGGIGPFVAGAALSTGGLYLLFSRVVVSSAGLWHGWFGSHYGAGGSIGATVLPFVTGVGLLFFDGKSRLGWVIVALSLAFMTLEVVSSLRVHFQPTSLPTLLAILGAIGGGIGLMARSFRAS